MKKKETTWRYALVRKTRRTPDGNMVHYYDVHEVYLDGDRITSWTENPVDCNGCEEVKETCWTLTTILRDILQHPVMELRKGKLIKRSKSKKP